MDDKRASRVTYILLSVSIAVLCMATLFHIIGMSTPYWVKYQYVHSHLERYYGLFEACPGFGVAFDNDRNAPVLCSDFEFDKISLKHRVVQVMAFLVLITGVTGTGSAILLLLSLQLCTKLSRKTVISITSVSAIASLAASAFAFSVIGTFMDRLYIEKDNNNKGGYASSFILCCMAAMLFPMGAFFLIAASKFIKTGNPGPEPPPVLPGTGVEETGAMIKTEGD